MNDDSWNSLMMVGVRERDNGRDDYAIMFFLDAAFNEGVTNEQYARANQALGVTYRKLGVLSIAGHHARTAVIAAELTNDKPLQAACKRDYAEVIHDMALGQHSASRRRMLDKAADMLLESLRLVRSEQHINVAEEAATISFLALVKYHQIGDGYMLAAESIARFEELEASGAPHHVYHVNALIRYIRILPRTRRKASVKRALALLPEAGLESRRRDILVALHFGDRGYRLAKSIAQRLKR